MSLVPIEIFCLKYGRESFNPALDILDFDIMFLSFCVFYNKLTIIELGVMYPDYLKLSEDNPDSWKIFAEKVRDIMSKCLEIPKSDIGFRDKKTFFNSLLRIVKKVD